MEEIGCNNLVKVSFVKYESNSSLCMKCLKCIISVCVIFLIILFSGCSGGVKSGLSNENGLYIIDFEQCMNTEQALMLSEIADTLEYLELKTPEDVVIANILHLVPSDDFLLVQARDGVFKFSWEGEYLQRIGRRGQGPGEYSLVFDVEVDPVRKEIILADSGKVLFYDFDGNFLRQEKWGSFTSICPSDSILWICEKILAHVYKYAAFALNDKGDTIASMLNPDYGKESREEGVRASTPKILETFYRYNSSLYLKGISNNDTIFQLSGIDFVPYAFIDRGKYKLPSEYAAWYSWNEYIIHGHRYWGVPVVVEDDRYFYLTALRHQTIDNGDNYRYIVYDKEKGDGFVTKNGKDTKITDDILGGPPVWTRWSTDDYHIDVVEWYELSDELKKGNYTLAPSLEKQFAGFGYSTNQLVVLFRKRK